MKKYIGYSVLVLVTAFVLGGGFIVYDSRDYFKELFEIKRDKLNLRNEASVDSLQAVIVKQTIKNDSLTIALRENNNLYMELQKSVDESKRTIDNLQNVIKHQNDMIKKQENK